MKDDVGVSIMLLDEKMDEGPILAQSKIMILNWPPHKNDLYKVLAEGGARLLAKTLPRYIEGDIKPVPQDASLATYCKLIKKENGEINLSDDPYKNFLKIRAFEGWPGTYFFVEKNGVKMRVKITDASYENGDLKILKVIPEGKSEMSYEDFKRGL
jgi:methionyl-tRNA formyltransferase